MTVATKQGSPVTVHLWDLEKVDKQTNGPHCHTTVSVVNGANTFPLSAVAVSSDYSILGFGYADGTVILVRGDIIRDRGSRQRVVYRSSSPVTGLEFFEDRGGGSIMLLVATVSQILTVPTTGRNSGKPEAILDKQGAALGCINKEDNASGGRLIVARDNEIVYYTAQMRGPSFVFSLPKKSIFSFQHYLVITSSASSTAPLAAPSSGPFSTFVGSATTRLLIVDTLNNFIAYSGQIAVGIKHIFVQWDVLHVIGSDGILYTFKEKDINSRLDILKQRNLYDVAIQLAKSLGCSETEICKIEKEYGDYLYKEDELEEALDHYMSAIDLGETSQIILKYRDSQNIDHLTRYLEALQRKGLATKQHTTLLFNSYAKLNDVDKLTKFVEDNSSPDSSNFNKNIDYDSAIRICRQAGYYSLAVYLAQRSGDADLAVQVKLRDLKDYKSCLEYVKSLEVKDALRILIQHSRELLDRFPVETTALLISLFTGKYVPVDVEITANPVIDGNQQIESSSLTAPVLQSYRALVNYMSSGNSEGQNADVSSIRSSTNSNHTGATNAGGGVSAIDQSLPTYQPPRPRLIFSSFIDHPNEFVIFLEACLESYDKFEANEKDRTDLLSTLFEMYLNLANHAGTPTEKAQWEAKAKDLAVSSKDRIDKNTILLLSHLVSYHDGELLARDNEEGFQVDLFRACISSGDVSGAIDILHKYGDQEKELFPLALNFFISSTSVLEKAGEEFNYVLNKIKEDQIMAPLQVIQALSVNSVATVGHVRQYLVDLIDHEKEEIDRNSKLAESYRNETNTKKEQIWKLLHDPTVVQYAVCSACGTTLDLPAVHFGCKHSYHQRCLNNSGMVGSPNAGSDQLQCPQCLPELEDIRALRRAQDDLADRNDLFETALQESDKKFKVVTDFLARGALAG